jgi:murein DD-endopeptidase MepM/ murein hydrolase activator NlpD
VLLPPALLVGLAAPLLGLSLAAAPPPGQRPASTPAVAATPGAFGPAAAAGVRAPAAWTAPLDGLLLVLEPFDPPPENWLPGHRGVDLAAAPGSPVLAAGVGTVAWAGPVGGRGVVTVLHDDGLRTTYEPVDPQVAVGDEVAAGDVLGRVAAGAGHCGGTPACLHWGLRRGDAYLDPMLLLRQGVPVLLPLPGG